MTAQNYGSHLEVVRNYYDLLILRFDDVTTARSVGLPMGDLHKPYIKFNFCSFWKYFRGIKSKFYP